MYTDYSRFSEVYDECGASDFSLAMGSSIIRFLDNETDYSEISETKKKHLDLCCGTGELCDYFRSMGFESVGVDISSEMLMNAKDKYPGLKFIQKDVTLPIAEEGYDIVTCVDDAINHLPGSGAVKGLIENAFNALKSGGYFVFDMVDTEYMDFDEEYPVYIGDAFSIIYEISQKGPGVITNHIRCMQDGKLKWESLISEHIYTCDEMTYLLRETGFEVLICDKDFYDEKSLIKWKYACKKL